MKTILIKDSILRDERFLKLTITKSHTLSNALGLWTTALILFSHKKDRVMPTSEWLVNPLANDLIDVGLFAFEDNVVSMVEPTHVDFEAGTQLILAKELKMTPVDLKILWNANCGRLPRVRELTPTRRRHCLARLKECDDKETWEKVITYIANDPFHKGLNERKWKADFDYFLRPKTWVMVTEKLDNSSGRKADFTV